MGHNALTVVLGTSLALVTGCRQPSPLPPPPPDTVPGLGTGLALRFGRTGWDYATALVPVSGGVFVGGSIAAEPAGSAGWPTPRALIVEPSGQLRELPSFAAGPIESDGADGLVVTGTAAGSLNYIEPQVRDSLDAYLARRTAAGSLVWEKRFPASLNEAGTAVAAGPTGAVAVTGTFEKSLDLGGGPLSGGGAFLAVFAPDGAHRWSRSIGQALPLALVFDREENVVVTGRFGEAVDLGGGVLTSQPCTDPSPCTPHPDAFVASYSGPDGTHRWSRRLGGSFSDLGSSLVLKPEGHLVVAGVLGGAPAPCEASQGGGVSTCTKPASLLLAELQALDGAVRWEKHFPTGTPHHDLSLGLAVGAGGTLFLVAGLDGLLELDGLAPQRSTGRQDVFVVRLAADGKPLGAGRFGASGTDRARRVTVQPDGRVYVLGEFQGEVDFGGTTLQSESGDVFLLRLDP